MYKLGAKLGAKLGSKPVVKPDAKPSTYPGAKIGANYVTICARFRKGMQKTPKIAPTHEIVPFYSKNEEKYTERLFRHKKDAKSSFCCSANWQN